MSEILICPHPVSWVMAGLLLEALGVSDAVLWSRARSARCFCFVFSFGVYSRYLSSLRRELSAVGGTEGVTESQEVKIDEFVFWRRGRGKVCSVTCCINYFRRGCLCLQAFCVSDSALQLKAELRWGNGCVTYSDSKYWWWWAFLEIMHIGMEGWNAAEDINRLILKLWCT